MSVLNIFLGNSYAYSANTETPNFVAMSNVVAILAVIPEDIFKDSNCKVNKYVKDNAQELLALIKNKMERQ